MRAYPEYFLAMFWVVVGGVLVSGLALAPGALELRLDWNVPESLLPPGRGTWAAAHGLGAFATLVAFGALLPLHVRQGLRQIRNLLTGISLLAALPLLALTGWGICYMADEAWSLGTSVAHMLIAVPVTAVAIIHAVRGRTTRST